MENLSQRSISIFAGDIKAAEQGVRHLDEQVDYNRIWPGTTQHSLGEAHYGAADKGYYAAEKSMGQQYT